MAQTETHDKGIGAAGLNDEPGQEARRLQSPDAHGMGAVTHVTESLTETGQCIQRTLASAAQPTTTSPPTTPKQPLGAKTAPFLDGPEAEPAQGERSVPGSGTDRTGPGAATLHQTHGKGTDGMGSTAEPEHEERWVQGPDAHCAGTVTQVTESLPETGQRIQRTLASTVHPTTPSSPSTPKQPWAQRLLLFWTV